MDIQHYITQIRQMGERWSPVSECLDRIGRAIDDISIQIKSLATKTSGSGAPSVPSYITAPNTPPSAASTWTIVNGLTVTDSGQGTLLITKSSATMGMGLKAIPVLAQFDCIMSFSDVAFGNLTNSTATIPEIGIFVTNGTIAGTSTAYGLTLGVFNTSPNTYKAARFTNPINVSPVAGVGTFQLVGPALTTIPTWFRVKSNGANMEFYVGDGLDWVLAYSIAYTPTHFGFGLNPTPSGGVASPQTVRLTSCNI